MSEQNFNEKEIQHILKLYKQRREKSKENYNKIKDTEEFKLKNRARAKEHYHKNKDMKKNAYENDKEYIKCRNSYNYYKKQNREEEFKKKFPDKYMLLLDRSCFQTSTEADADQHTVADVSSI